ncbi:MAG: hypothetical protein AAF389_15000 [Gemmatimonadota bacterium]
MSAPGFRITSGRGFHLSFPNGYTVSVQFGLGNYCANRNLESMPSDLVAFDAQLGAQGCPDAEVAVWGPDGDMLHGPDGSWDDCVNGWQSPNEVAALIAWAVAQPASA